MIEKTPEKTDREMFMAIFLIGFLCLMLELIQIRMLSFFLGSISNFLAIPIALFGLALGSLFCHFIYKGEKDRLVRIASISVFPVLAVTFVVFFIVANTFFSRIHVGMATPWNDSAKLLIYSLLFLPGYINFGILLTTYFSTASDKIGRLYFYDLVGAGLGCFATSLLFTFTDLPVVLLVLLGGCFVLAISTSTARRRLVLIAGLIGMALLIALAIPGIIFKERPKADVLASTLLGRSKNSVVIEAATKWNHLTRTGLYRQQSPRGPAPQDRFVIVQDDGISNVSVDTYDPSLTPDSVLRTRLHHALPQLLGIRPNNILVMFAGAGRDMLFLNTLYEGKVPITGVELNDAVRSLSLVPEAESRNLGAFFSRPNINYVISEGRDFLNNDKARYDLILVATNGAVHAARTGHSRKYLDTKQACEAYLDHLTPDGTLIFVNQPIESKIQSFRKLFEERKLGDFSKSVYAFGRRGSKTLQSAVIQLNGISPAEADIIRRQQRLIMPAWETVYHPYGFKLPYFRPFVETTEEESKLVVDDKPFIKKIKFDEFRLFPSKAQLTDLEYSSNWIKIFTVLIFGFVSLGVIIVARFLGKKTGRLPLLWLVYFFVSGISYMGVEIGLIAKTELFMGNPLYAVAVILASFLISNGVGAWLQDKYHVMRGPLSMILLTALSVAWGLITVELLNTQLLSLHIMLKAVLVFVAVLPSGICLGMYYPLGVQTLVGKGQSDAIPVTYGAATLSSVLGSSLAMTLIVNFGFSTVIIGGGLGYMAVALIFLAAKRFA